MLKIKDFDNLDKLLNEIKEKKSENYYFLGEFLREIDSDYDEILVLLGKNGKKILLKCKNKNTDVLPKISDIYYAAYNFENEIYDFYGNKIEGDKSHILRLHLDKKNYFPKRLLGKPAIKEKREFIFTETKGEGNVKVQVGPIHAGIIPPGHFRFTCDGENTLNLDIQLGWKHRGVENYFMQEKDLDKLLNASNEIVGHSSVAYSIAFCKIIENSSDIKISETEEKERIIALELERIYNYLWTMGAMLNDVGQGFLLNGFQSIREEFLDLFYEVYGSRTLKGIIGIGKNNINLDKNKVKLILKTIKKNYKRFNELFELGRDSAGIYDRFKETGIVHNITANSHGALGIVARSSGIFKDARKHDEYYKDIEIKGIFGEQGDVFDRFTTRGEEILQSIKIIKNLLKNSDFDLKDKKVKEINLKDGYYISQTEGQIGEVLMLTFIKNNKIKYFKIKDPSFMNWTLLEYAVLNNIIADFPICNKSFDMSYSGFDL